MPRKPQAIARPAVAKSSADVKRRPESAAAMRDRAQRLLAGLQSNYPNAVCALDHRNAFELLIATILSAQCTDARVNLVTPELFRQFPTPALMAAASQQEIEALVKSTGFYRNKAKSILGASRLITERFAGSVPRTMEELLQLPGVARKTANVVLGTAYGMNEGVVVDTHVGRLSARMGLTRHADPVKIERDLMKLFEQRHWTQLSHLLIHHGRKVCTARKAMCENCPLSEDCPMRGVTIQKAAPQRKTNRDGGNR
jgi:endonuclease-3